MSPSTISCSPAGLTETGLLSRARRDPRTLSGYTADLPFKPASALISVEALEVLGCFIGIYPKAVMRERVNERRDEYCPLARGPDEESRVRETARFVEVSKAGIVCPARCRPAFADYVDEPRDGRADEGEARAGQGRFRRSAQQKQHDRSNAEKSESPVTAGQSPETPGSPGNSHGAHANR